jgi:hypothetical protein
MQENSQTFITIFLQTFLKTNCGSLFSTSEPEKIMKRNLKNWCKEGVRENDKKMEII